MYDVITVGSATLDVFARTESCEEIKKRGKECIAYPVGAKILIDELLISSGGGGTNTAASLAKLGHKVAFLGKIGTSENSSRLVRELKDYGIDSLAIRKKDSRTGYSIILDSMHHDRTILNFRGSNDEMSFNEIDLKKVRAKWLLFTAMIGKSFKAQEKLAGYAKKRGMKIAYVLNPSLAKKGKRYVSGILNKADIVIMNKEEAEFLTGKRSIEKNLREINKANGGIAVITDGNKGAHAFDGSNIYHAKPNKIRVVETTGAGDAFASGFLSGMIKKNDIEFAIKLGMAQAESVIQYHGAKNKLLAYKEALREMKRRPVKIRKIF